jgi:hypothetical protein
MQGGGLINSAFITVIFCVKWYGSESEEIDLHSKTIIDKQ